MGRNPHPRDEAWYKLRQSLLNDPGPSTRSEPRVHMPGSDVIERDFPSQAAHTAKKKPKKKAVKKPKKSPREFMTKFKDVAWDPAMTYFKSIKLDIEK